MIVHFYHLSSDRILMLEKKIFCHAVSRYNKDSSRNVPFLLIYLQHFSTELLRTQDTSFKKPPPITKYAIETAAALLNSMSIMHTKLCRYSNSVLFLEDIICELHNEFSWIKVPQISNRIFYYSCFQIQRQHIF